MRWDAVLRANIAAADGDPMLSSIYGAEIRLAGDVAPTKPALGLRLITDSVNELWEPALFQWEQWTLDDSDLVLSERALRDLFVHDVPVTIEGVYMWSQFEEGAELGTLTGLGPDQQTNLFGRALRIRQIPIREALRAGRSTP